MYLFVKGTQVFKDNQPFNSQKGDNNFFSLHVMCKLTGTVSHVSVVANWPLVVEIFISITCQKLSTILK